CGFAEPVVRASGPVQPCRTSVGTWKCGSTAFERLCRIDKLVILVGPPADLPCRPLGVPAVRKATKQFAEDAVGRRIIIDDDVVRGEIVERFGRPRAVR